ncbi:MAG: hypothetical protein HY434_02560 [Candidatus Liptonbacteria bacterium]|nr:hypothetical protein [Candidatus Liptonbacteria bacterium]
MPRGFITKRDNLTKDTLVRLAKIGVIVIAASTSPYFLQRLVSRYFQDKIAKVARARAKKLRELEKRKLVSFKELGGGSVRIELTRLGKELVRIYDLENMTLKKPKSWDKKWRIIIYDIPVSQRRASQALSKKFRQLGLFPLQRSVWVSPHECLEEIEFIATVFEIDMDRCICYFRTRNIPREKEVRKFFGI